MHNNFRKLNFFLQEVSIKLYCLTFKKFEQVLTRNISVITTYITAFKRFLRTLVKYLLKKAFVADVVVTGRKFIPGKHFSVNTTDAELINIAKRESGCSEQRSDCCRNEKAFI